MQPGDDYEDLAEVPALAQLGGNVRELSSTNSWSTIGQTQFSHETHSIIIISLSL